LDGKVISTPRKKEKKLTKEYQKHFRGENKMKKSKIISAILAFFCFLLWLDTSAAQEECTDISGNWEGSWSEISCDGNSYSGLWTGYVTNDCRFYGTDNWDTVSGKIDPSNKVLTGDGISIDGCGLITMTGLFAGDYLSGQYTYSEGGNGKFTGGLLPPPAPDRPSPNFSFDPHLNRIQSVFIAYYLRPADPGGLYWWAAQLRDCNGDLSAIIDAFATSEESLRLWGEINSGNIGEVTDDVYYALFNRPADAGGKQFYVDGFNAGQFTPGTIVLNILDGAQNEDRQAIENKLTYSNYFVSVLDPDGDWQGPYEATYDAEDEQTARDLLGNITWDSDIITEQQVRDDVMNYIADPGDPILN
jgi:hypothetical protein